MCGAVLAEHAMVTTGAVRNKTAGLKRQAGHVSTVVNPHIAMAVL